MITLRRTTTANPSIYNSLNRSYATLQPIGQESRTQYAIRQTSRRPTTSFAATPPSGGMQVANLRNRGGRMDRYGTSFTEDAADQAATDALEPADFGMSGDSFKSKLPRKVLERALSPALISELRRRGVDTQNTSAVSAALQTIKSAAVSTVGAAGSALLPVGVYGAAGVLTGMSSLASAVDYGLSAFDNWMKSGEVPPASPPPPPVPAEEIEQLASPPQLAQATITNFMSPSSLDDEFFDTYEPGTPYPPEFEQKQEEPERLSESLKKAEANYKKAQEATRYRYNIYSFVKKSNSLRVIDIKSKKTRNYEHNMYELLDPIVHPETASKTEPPNQNAVTTYLGLSRKYSEEQKKTKSRKSKKTK